MGELLGLECGFWLVVAGGLTVALVGLAVWLPQLGRDDPAEGPDEPGPEEEMDSEDRRYLGWWLKERQD